MRLRLFVSKQYSEVGLTNGVPFSLSQEAKLLGGAKAMLLRCSLTNLFVTIIILNRKETKKEIGCEPGNGRRQKRH